MATLWPNKMLLMMQDEPTDLHLLLLPIVSIGPTIILLPIPRIGQLHLQWLLQIASLGPIIVLVDAANTLEWAHCICSSCHQWLRFGPTDLHLLLLPIVLIGPTIILLPMPGMGQLHLQWLLQIALLGPIIVLVDAADTLEWAHCICSSCRQWLRFGP